MLFWIILQIKWRKCLKTLPTFLLKQTVFLWAESSQSFTYHNTQNPSNNCSYAISIWATQLDTWYVLVPRRFSSDAMKSPRCLATAYQWTEITHLLHLCTFNTFFKALCRVSNFLLMFTKLEKYMKSSMYHDAITLPDNHLTTDQNRRPSNTVLHGLLLADYVSLL